MAKSDIAIGGGGGTSWERCCLGLPTLLVTLADNQISGARALESAGSVHWLGDHAHVTAKSVADALQRIVSDDVYRVTMARSAAAVCDGLGIRRVLQRLTPLTTEEGATVTLRPATEADGDMLLAWQHDPDTRRYARNPNRPTRDEHFRWLKQKLSDPECIFSIVERNGVSAGVVRLDRCKREKWEVSVLTAPDHKRHGIARAGLSLAGDLMPDVIFVAEVKPENKASQRLFTSLGYRQSATDRFERPAAETGGKRAGTIV